MVASAFNSVLFFISFFFLMLRRPPRSTLFPYTTLFRSKVMRHLGFLAGQIGRLITISTTPVIAGDSFEMDAVGALRLSPLRQIGRAVQQECRDRSRMPSSA